MGFANSPWSPDSGVEQIIIVMQLYKTTPNIHIVCIQKRNKTTNKKKEATKNVTIEEEWKKTTRTRNSLAWKLNNYVVIKRDNFTHSNFFCNSYVVYCKKGKVKH